MEKIVVVECLKRRTRVVVAEDGVPCEYVIEYRDEPRAQKGAIYVGRVVSVVSATQSAFVDIGTGKNAILHVEKDDRTVRPGALLTVQIQREPPSPDKGPRVTREIQLPGRLCVLLSGKSSVGISQKVTDEAQRARLNAAAKAACPQGMGIIVRTQAQEATDEALAAEMDELVEQWRSISVKAQGMMRPGCVQESADAMDTLLRDLLTPDVTRVVCDDETIAQCMAQAVPQIADKVEHYAGRMPVLDAMQLETRLQKALTRKVLLKSGASVVIDHCEAMTVIDVNSGKSVTHGDAEQTALCVNLEAAREIARQLRLRDIGGIIVVDFIDMASEAHRETLLEAFRTAVSRDRSHVYIGGLSALGLCEMTRSTLRQELRESVGRRCRICGAGYCKSWRERAYDVLAEMRRKAWHQGEDGQYLLGAHPSLIQAVAQLREDFPCAALFAQLHETQDEEQFTLTQLLEGESTAGWQQIDIRSGKK